MRWLPGVERRVGKTASSVVVYLDKGVFLGAEAKTTLVGKGSLWSRTDGGPNPDFLCGA